ncbi:MAG: hypothetical protein V9F05_11010 [Chitinophagaceae bacterium]
MKAYLVSILLVFTTFIYPYVLSAQAMLGYTDAQGDFYVNDGGKDYTS